MISLKAFVTAIHDAVLSANQALMDQNVDVLGDYFEHDESDPTEDRETGVMHGRMRARSVVMQYPHLTESGVKYTDVFVPLVTLVPFSPTQIDKVRFTVNFEAAIVDDKVHILFPKKRKEGMKGRFTRKSPTKGAAGSLEIVISPTETPTGLEDLIEGYEKSLRSQIPH